MLDSIEANYPIQKEQQSLYTLFWKVIGLKDSTKVANLQKTEIGDCGITVRDAQRLAKLGRIFNNQVFSDFYRDHAEITNATSMARDGFLDELFVSSKKSTVRARKTSSPLTPQKWKLFNRNKTQESQ
jgi:hypothetical protein